MRRLLTALWLCCLPFAATATPLEYDITESLSADWHWRLDDARLSDDASRDVLDFRNRLNIRLRVDNWTFGARLDAAYFPSPPSSQYRNDLRPEELFVTYKAGDWTLTAGDDYLTLGRGMALSLRKFDEVGFATNLRGAHARYRDKIFQFRLGAGFTNVLNVDSVEEKWVPDPNDLIFLARIEAKLSRQFTLGAHAVDIERRHSPIRRSLSDPLFDDGGALPLEGREYGRTLIGGLTAKLTTDTIDFEIEGGILDNQEQRMSAQGPVDAGKMGFALYSSLTGSFGPWTLLVEGKHYDHWRVESSLHPDTAAAQDITRVFPYISPPSLERIDQRVRNNTDVSGLHVRLDRRLPRQESGAQHSLFASAAGFIDAPAEGEWTFHGYLGWDFQSATGDRLKIQTGYRHEEAPDAGQNGIIRLSMFHIDLDWSKTLGKQVDLQLHWDHELRRTNLNLSALEESYFEGTSYLSLNFAPSWSITAQLEYLTDSSTQNPLFPGGYIQWKPDPASFVRLFVGRSKGGLKCAGGVCRIFPNFEGVKLETTLRF